MLIGVAAWFLWELWSAIEPKAITDDFLRLLNDSFGRDWRNPLTWPWARVLWAYGFTVVGATLAAGVGARDLDARRIICHHQGADHPNRHVTKFQTGSVTTHFLHQGAV